MAFLNRNPSLCVLVLIFASLVFLTSPVHSLNCSSQKFTNSKLYSKCIDLPTLGASLHWTHIAENSSLSIAFIAPPAKPDGWIAWAINPTQTGMAGSQALVAFKDSNGSMAVKTYNISSYSSIVEGKISLDVSESIAEYSDKSMKIFATVKLPKTMTEVNHVWQVGGLVKGGMPGKHEFLPANLKSMGKLQLPMSENAQSNGTTTVGSPSIAPSTSITTSITPSLSPRPTNSASRNTVMYALFLLVIMSCNGQIVVLSGVLNYSDIYGIQNELYRMVPEDEEEGFKYFFRLSKKTFEYHCSLVREDLISRPPSGLINIEGRLLSVEKQVAIALRRLAYGESQVSVGASFNVGQSTVSQVTWRFIEAMEERARHHLKWPDNPHLQKIKSEFEKSFNLPNCCGAIDATHIVMTLPAVQTSDDWCDQVKNYSMLVQGIVDHKSRFLDIVTGWPGGMTIPKLLKFSGFYKLCESGNRLNQTEL
ncbi:hypothetical protein LXL04_000785 [Taraxacum kok-saghyz]